MNSITSYTLENVVDYNPYGKVLRHYSQNDQEKYLTTGNQRDKETSTNNFAGGLDYRIARFSDTDNGGRFLSMDPLDAEAPDWNPYRYAFCNPVNWVDPSGLFEDGYQDNEGNLHWAHDQKGKSFQRGGKTYNKISDDFLAFSDKARNEKKEIEFSGKLDVGHADLDDLTAVMNHVNQYQRRNIKDGYGSALTSSDVFEFTNSTNGNWTISGGNVGGNHYIGNFKTANGSAKAVITPMAPSHLSLINIPRKFSPVTYRDVIKGPDGRYQFPQHKSQPRPYGMRLQGEDNRVSGGGNRDINILIILFDSGTDYGQYWKRAARSWK